MGFARLGRRICVEPLRFDNLAAHLADAIRAVVDAFECTHDILVPRFEIGEYSGVVFITFDRSCLVVRI